MEGLYRSHAKHLIGLVVTDGIGGWWECLLHERVCFVCISSRNIHIRMYMYCIYIYVFMNDN